MSKKRSIMKEKLQYVIKDFPSSRQSTFDVGYIGVRSHHVKALLELDVTLARELIKNYRNKTREELSFTVWIIKCISQAIAENKSVHGIRKGKNRLVIFDDIDISVIVEKEINGEKAPLPLVIRNVNEKKLSDIQLEIKSAKEQKVTNEKDYVLGENQYKWAMSLFVALPQWIRLIIWKFILKDPFLLKKMAGTVVVTSLSMIKNVRGWVIPVTIHPICFALGSIVKKPGIFEEKISVREYLYMTVLINHDVIDGAPAARFMARLTSLIESGYGL
jgi:pyruvate/2-oxoglutarate dehydrogenase complex dihydrolipoamide acyltransferase (E2) component